MKIIGLTGGIGSGKSAAATCFREAGFPVIDADSIGHKILETDRAVCNAVLDAFGNDIASDDGTIDREKLAARAFQNDDARQRLNELLHPAIIAEVGRQCAAFNEEGHDTVIVEAALIGEAGQKDPWLSGLILVMAAEGTRITRLVQYRQFTREEAQRRIAAQRPPELKITIATWIINNDTSLANLRNQVLKIADSICTNRAKSVTPIKPPDTTNTQSIP